MATIKDIAKHVGVSQATVSIYLNDKNTSRVSESTKVKIDEAVQALNYRKNIFASNLASSSSKLIGILLPTELPLFQNLYTNELLSGLQSRLADRGYSIVFLPSKGDKIEEILEGQLEHSIGCEGYVLFSTGFCSEKEITRNIESVLKINKPFVTLNIAKSSYNINQVFIEGIIKPIGLRYLVEKGHKNIISIIGRSNGINSKNHRLKIEQYLKGKKLEHNLDRIYFGEYNEEKSKEVVEVAINKFKDTTAIYCASDLMALSVIDKLKELGYRIPQDISVVGRNNSMISKIADITTVNLNMSQCGIQAAEILIGNIEKEQSRVKVTINSSIVERGTVKSLC